MVRKSNVVTLQFVFSQTTVNEICFDVRAWRNWQTRQTQDLVGDRGGSSPFIRTTENLIDFYRLGFLFCYSLRDLNEEKICLQISLQGKQSSGLFIGYGRTGEIPAFGTTSQQGDHANDLEKSRSFCFYTCCSF